MARRSMTAGENTGPFKDSHQLALEWEAVNMARALELNDALDACPDITTKRALYATFTKDERNGVMPEYARRTVNRQSPIGSLVKPANTKFGINIKAQSHTTTTYACHLGLAIVIGQDKHGSHTRYLMLQPPWRNKEGEVLHFAEASSHELVVVESLDVG